MTYSGLIKIPLLKILVLFATVISVLLAVQLILTPKASAIYENGTLINDNLFLDAQSMNASGIQSFLAGKGAGLANMNFVIDCDVAGAQAKAIYLSLGAPCGQSAPASSIIYYAAQVYGISPKVILATMQKEQGVTTAANPTSWQINQAMGYNCPTSGGCGASTFFYQIDFGTWALRFHYERARGNLNWWYTSTSWTCGTAKPSYYVPNLYPNQNVNFIDPYSGTHYTTVYITNAATSAMYCYTPHVYNNHHNSPHPDEPKGATRCYNLATHPLAGDRGRCYTGSFNFVRFYELWFNENVQGYAFHAKFAGMSPYPTLKPGETAQLFIRYKNTGNHFWKDDTSVFPSWSPTRLATTSPINRPSAFASGWSSVSRPTGKFAAIYEADGVTPAGQLHTVYPGQIAQFNFNVTVPPWFGPGTYREYIQPVLEGSPFWDMGGWGYFDITVVKPVFSASYHSMSAYPSMQAGQARTVFISYKNTGNTYWKDDVTVFSGYWPLHLATTSPINRPSQFRNPGWLNASRPAGTFHAVYEANGITLASDQHTVQPGQIAMFQFDFTAPSGTTPGVYREYIQPVLEAAPVWDIGGWGYIDITITP